MPECILIQCSQNPSCVLIVSCSIPMLATPSPTQFLLQLCLRANRVNPYKYSRLWALAQNIKSVHDQATEHHSPTITMTALDNLTPIPKLERTDELGQLQRPPEHGTEHQWPCDPPYQRLNAQGL